jgi:hypothetical protein
VVGMVRRGAGAGYTSGKGVLVIEFVLYPGKTFPASWSPDEPFVLIRQRLVEKDFGFGRTGASGARQFESWKIASSGSSYKGARQGGVWV